MLRHFLIVLLFSAGFTKAVAIDSKFERYTASKFGISVTIDVMYMDRDGDGCYDYKIIWLNGSPFAEGPLLRAGGGGVPPSDWTSTGRLRDFDYASCLSSINDTIRLVIKDTTTNATIATITQACGSASHTWTPPSPPPVLSVNDASALSNAPVTVFPNPITGEVLNIRVQDGSLVTGVCIVSSDGTVRQLQVNLDAAGSIGTIELGNLPAGAYRLKVSLGSGLTIAYPVVKN